ncbi:hypothetical protein HID58_001524, partial [Brassica napus]
GSMTLTFVAHAMAAIMVLVWNISYRGGLAWEEKIENVGPALPPLHPVLIGFVIMGGEVTKALPLEKPVKKLIHLVLHAIALALGI